MFVRAHGASTTPPSVLVIDDERELRESIRLALQPHLRVTTVGSGELGLRLLRHVRVDVVVLELMTPGLDLIELFKKIHETDPDVRILIVSGESLDDLAHVRTHGASASIPKRTDGRALVESVERAVEETRRGREQAAEPRATRLREVRAAARPTRGEGEPRRDAAAMLSHDLKNRMQILLGYAQLLRQGKLDGWHATTALDAIEGNARKATTQTMNFLHAEERDGGSPPIHKTRTSLNEIVEQVMEDEAASARLKRIDLQVDLDSGLPSVDLDVAMMSCCVTNLLGNALHHSPEGGVVRVDTRRFGGVMILRIRDHGPGVPAEDVPRLFEPYTRGAKSASSSSTGLGLYFVRTTVDAHDGFVSATFPVDGGSAFVIALPCPPSGNA